MSGLLDKCIGFAPALGVASSMAFTANVYAPTLCSELVLLYYNRI